MTNTTQTNTNQRGFTLVEVALIITILGLIIAPFFNFLSQRYLKKELVKSEEKTERITSAISAFLIENGRYPCPARPNDSPEDTTFGRENCSGATGNIYYGALPTQDLRLPTEDAVNLHGWKYLYAVNQSLTSAATFLLAPTSGGITVNIDSNGDGTIDSSDTRDLDGDGSADIFQASSNLHFVVIDPGKDGKGSASLNGSNNYITSGFFNCTGSARDVDNCNKDGDFVQMERNTLNSNTSSSYYDDTVIFTLARKESTFWKIDKANTSAAEANITMRAGGSLGVGITDSRTAEAKLHVRGGNLKAINGRRSATDVKPGHLITSGNVDVDRNLDAQNANTAYVGAQNGYYYNGTMTGSGSAPSCSSGQLMDANGSCCTTVEIDSETGLCEASGGGSGGGSGSGSDADAGDGDSSAGSGSDSGGDTGGDTGGDDTPTEPTCSYNRTAVWSTSDGQYMNECGGDVDPRPGSCTAAQENSTVQRCAGVPTFETYRCQCS